MYGFCQKEFLRHFYAKVSAINHPNNIPICLAGQDRDGNCAVNELTVLLREVYDGMGLYSPKFQIRVTEGVSDEYLKGVLDSIRRGRSSYVFMNDDSVIPALEKLGIASVDARDYVPVGCYESDAYGEVPCTCAGTVNLLKCVETALFDGCDQRTGERIGPATGEAAQFADYGAFLGAVRAQIRHAVEMSMKRVDAWEKCYARLNPSPLFSAGMACCAERRKDAYRGGALYGDTSINLIGVTDAADALCAARWAVYEQHRVGMAELASVLRNNWQGAETLRRQIRTEAPRYGDGSGGADETARSLCAFAVSLFNGKPDVRGGRYRAGLFSIDWVYPWGEGTGATPEGRFAGEPLSKNLNATLGSDRHGPGALAHSAALLAGCGIPNGAVLDLLLHPTLTEGEAGLAAMLALLRVYMKEGGQCLQMNVFDAETLREAQAHPERYENLQVRVCGWNALFTRLSRKEQDMFIRQASAQ